MDNINGELILETLDGSKSIGSIHIPVLSKTKAVEETDRNAIKNMVDSMIKTDSGWARIYGYVQLSSGSILGPSELKSYFQKNSFQSWDSSSIFSKLIKTLETSFIKIRNWH